MEFGPDKSVGNKQKHGIDFFEAHALWSDPDLIVIPARVVDEPRELVIGRIGRCHWAAIITCRENRVRLISVRRARKEEIEIYES